MYTYAQSFGGGPKTAYLLFDTLRGWHMHDYPSHWEDHPNNPDRRPTA